MILKALSRAKPSIRYAASRRLARLRETRFWSAKLTAALLIAVLLLSACSGFITSGTQKSPRVQETELPAESTLIPIEEEPTAALTPEPTPVPTPEPTPVPTPVPTPTPDPITQLITIAVGGDVLPDGRIGTAIKENRYSDVLDEVTAERFRNSDIAMINLETSVSDRGTAIPGKAYTFRSPPENLVFLTDYMGVDIVSLANNHTPDFGWDAFEDTLTNVHESGMAYIGAGMNLSEAAAPYIADINGVKIAFFAANQILSYKDWPATEKSPGMVISREPDDLKGTFGDNIKDAAKNCDYVIVFMHWGIERDTTPSDRQVRYAKALIDIGVDCVIGAHPHIVQTFDYYKGKPIIYSVGNFLFNANCPETCVLYLSLQDGEISIEISPMKISGTKTYLPDETTWAKMLEKWAFPAE